MASLFILDPRFFPYTQNRFSHNQCNFYNITIVKRGVQFIVLASQQKHVMGYSLEESQRDVSSELNRKWFSWRNVENIYIRPPDKSAYWKIIFVISHPKHILWVLKRTVSIWDGSFEHSKHMFRWMGKKIITILRSLNFFNWIYVYMSFS